MVAVVQLAIMLGAMVGGLVFDAGGYRGTFELAAVVLVAASAVSVLAARAGAQASVALATAAK